MLTAAKAKEIALENRSELKSVLKYIYLRAKQGYCNGVFWFEKLTMDRTIQELRNLGYEVEILALYYKNKPIYKISW